jgi:hypothetical protein
MSTEPQRESARINGAWRTGRRVRCARQTTARGPKTPEGKRIASINAACRTLLASSLLIEGESNAHFAALLLVESMAAARWRKLRLMGMESEVLLHEIRNHRGMSQEPLSHLGHAVFAARNLTDRSRILPFLSAEQSDSELKYSRAHAALLKSLSTHARRFHLIEPGVPEPSSTEQAENSEPPP